MIENEGERNWYEIFQLERRLWIKEFYSEIGYAIFMAEQNNDASLRHGYNILENSIEIFLRSFLINEKNIKDARDEGFQNLISMAKTNIANAANILDSLFLYRDARNILHHKPVYLSVTKTRFYDYLGNIVHLCKLMGFEYTGEIIKNVYYEILQNIFKKNTGERFERLHRVNNLLIGIFETYSGYGDIIPGCIPGSSGETVVENIKVIIYGMFEMGKINGNNGNCTRVLELVYNDGMSNNYTYLISYIESHMWYCFYDSLWSQKDKESKHIKDIREFIEQNVDKIAYKVSNTNTDLFKGVFDHMFDSNILMPDDIFKMEFKNE